MPGYRLLRHQNYAATAEPSLERCAARRSRHRCCSARAGTPPASKAPRATTPVAAHAGPGLSLLPLVDTAQRAELADPAPPDNASADAAAIPDPRHSPPRRDRPPSSCVRPNSTRLRRAASIRASGSSRRRRGASPGRRAPRHHQGLARQRQDNFSVLPRPRPASWPGSAACCTSPTQRGSSARATSWPPGPRVRRAGEDSHPDRTEKEITGLPTTSTLSASCASSPATWSSRTRPPWGPGGATRPRSIPRCGHISGRTFPATYTVPEGRLDEAVFTAERLDWQPDAAGRGLDMADAEPAWRLAERLRGDRFFLDQTAELRGAGAVAAGTPAALAGRAGRADRRRGAGPDPVQIALLGELARSRGRLRARDPSPWWSPATNRRSSSRAASTGASPRTCSAPCWGATRWNSNTAISAARREPGPPDRQRLEFLRPSPKALRPSANRQSFVDDAGVELAHARPLAGGADENGRILIVPLPEPRAADAASARALWQELVETLGELPGRVVVDLTETLLSSSPTGRRCGADRHAGG